MTFADNTAAREHLDEWSCGVGAGAAAALMAARNLTSAEMLASIGSLQGLLRSPAIRQQLSWAAAPAPPSPSPPGNGKFVCGAGRCFESDGHSSAASHGTYANASCGVAGAGRPGCGPLRSDEWLLLKAHWRVAANKSQATAVFDTRLKKSELPASSLPAGEQRAVSKGTTLVFAEPAATADGNYDLGRLSDLPPAPPGPPAPGPPAPAPGPSGPVTSHSPVFRWEPKVDRSEAFSVVLTVTEAATSNVVWESPPTWHLPSTGQPEEVGGVAIYQGPPLKAGTEYRWAIEEKAKNGTVGASAGGAFRTSDDLLSARVAAAKAVANISTLYQGTARSILCRIKNGSMPTSVNGGYSGMFTRDSGVQLLGLMELAAARRDAGDEAAAAKILAKVEEVLTFMTRELANFTWMPHIIDNPPGGANGINGNIIDESDQTAYVMMAYGTYVTMNSAAAEFEAAHYELMKRLLNSHVRPGASAEPADKYGHSTNSHITRGCCAGVPYWNETLGLLANLNSEHSREGHYWSGYTQITNSAMVEALRLMSLVADRRGDQAQAAAWRSRRTEVLEGIQRSLTAPVDPSIAKQTGSATMYAELRARSQSFPPCSVPTVMTNPDELLTGLSWYNLAPISSFAASVGHALNATHSETGMRADQMDATMLQYRADGFFVWQPQGADGRAFPMALNYVNASQHQYDVAPGAGLTAAKPGTGQARMVITMGWAWEAAWAAHRQDWPRVALMHEWLASLPVGYPADADVKGYPSIAEGYDYDCFRATPDASDDCYHDIANGIMVGWFLWCETITRRALGLSTAVEVDCP